ncbi:hypothetical protein PLESTB_001387500 [Pleodorina starrii]|uniref:sulfiredoxin n=1 Tax=Pleodorina starrii TaxID=330485 RepID=A0A9W6F7I4_9CHLO|nr:hypothetical protein PLESTB_001387500 [Pleodorina starrii]
MCDAPTCKPGSAPDGLPASIFVSDEAEIHDVPMSVIRRPLISSVDRAKVEDFKQKIQAGVALTPIEVAWVERPEGSYYFSFGGCHRWAAHSERHHPRPPHPRLAPNHKHVPGLEQPLQEPVLLIPLPDRQLKVHAVRVGHWPDWTHQPGNRAGGEAGVPCCW